MLEIASPAHATRQSIPLALKVVYSLFMLILVPYYWISYGPTNFLWFCDIALLVTLIGIWRESPLLISTQAIAIVAPQMLWCTDFVLKAVSGTSIAGLADYMFDPTIPLFVRGLSLFHGWMPFLLLWLVARIGYDRRALWLQTAIAIVVLIATYLLVPSADGPAGNVNRVLERAEWATNLHPLLWVGLLCVAYPVLIYVPSHIAFCWAERRGFLPHNNSSSTASELL